MRQAFRAFDCEIFDGDGGTSYLRADFTVTCDSAEHATIVRLAWLGIGAYPLATLTAYTLLFAAQRRALEAGRPTELSRALVFLTREYEVRAYAWRGP